MRAQPSTGLTVLAAWILVTSVLSPILVAQAAPEDPEGWQGTKWGMTPEQVIAALSGRLPARLEVAPAGNPIVRVLSFDIDGATCQPTLIFGREGLLREVDFSWDRIPRGLEDALRAKYGKPNEIRRSPVNGLEDMFEVRVWLLPKTKLSLEIARDSDGMVAVVILRYQDRLRLTEKV